MKYKIRRFFLFFSIAIMASFTLVPPVHQIPEANRFVPEVVYQKLPVETITLSTVDATARKGEEVCVAVTVKGFQNILTMQYTMNWDPKVLKFKEIKNFGLKGLDDRNFGFQIKDKGLLTYSWYDQALKGVTMDDGFQLYELCFEAVGDPGSETTIGFSSTPTVIEISNSSSVFLDLRTDDGIIKIE